MGVRYALGLDQLHWLELILEHFLTLYTKPLIQNGGVNASEVGVVFEIAIIESIKLWMIADDT